MSLICQLKEFLTDNLKIATENNVSDEFENKF